MYFVYVRYVAAIRSPWPDCICLVHPMMVTQDLDEALEFKNSIQIQCPSLECKYAGCLGEHIKVIQEVPYPCLGIFEGLCAREIRGKATKGTKRWPQIQISFWSTGGKGIRYKYDFLPFYVPGNGYSYTETLLPGIPVYSKQWCQDV